MKWISAFKRRRFSGPAGQGTNTYKIIWDHYARHDAKDWIFTGATDESFESSGRSDAERLGRFVTKDSVVLNIGCGVGRVEKYLAPLVDEMHAVDVSGEMVALAKKRLAGIANVQLREVGLDEYLSAYPDARFDLVFSLLVLQHMEREHAYMYLQHAHRVLKAGGTLFVQFPNLLSLEYTRAFLEPIEQKHLNASRVRTYTVEEVRHLMKMLDFEVVELKTEAGREGNAEIYIYATKPSLTAQPPKPAL
jgi:SAM-dependent methyltransferase